MKKNIKVPESIFNDINYYHYIVQYQGDIEEEISKEPGYYVTIINDKYAIVSVLKEKLEIDIEEPIFHLLYMLNQQKCIHFKKFHQLKLLKLIFYN